MVGSAGCSLTLFMWAVEKTNNGVHVVPIDDIKEHEMVRSCWCKPALKHNENVIVHNSLDGREYMETESNSKSKGDH